METFSVPHDVDTVSYTFQAGDRKIGYATDLGTFGEQFIARMSNCSAVVLESNHDLEMLRLSLTSGKIETPHRRNMRSLEQ